MEGYNPKILEPDEDGNEYCALLEVIEQHLISMPRWKAETDLTFKQVIPYVIVEHRPTGHIYMTTRIGGDDRLKGQHSIGLGGHMDEDERILDTLYRELEEEVGLHRDDIADISLCGFLSSTMTEVDSVHLGLIYHITTNREDISCLEKDKLMGDWFTVEQLQEARKAGHMESWSTICFDSLLRGEATE